MAHRMQRGAGHTTAPLAARGRHTDVCGVRHRQVACRGVVPQGERDGWWRKDCAPNLVEVQDGLQDIMAILEANRDRLVIVDYFAPWCASCKALYPKLNKICGENSENLVIAKVNFEENKDLAKQLGVKVLPFFHAYHGSMGRVAAFSSSITKIQRLKDCIKLFGQPYCDIASHNGDYDVSKSLPEFNSLPHPDDATVLKFTEGEYDQEATMAEKQKKAAASNGTGAESANAESEGDAAQQKEAAGV